MRKLRNQNVINVKLKKIEDKIELIHKHVINDKYKW